MQVTFLYIIEIPDNKVIIMEIVEEKIDIIEMIQEIDLTETINTKSGY